MQNIGLCFKDMDDEEDEGVKKDHKQRDRMMECLDQVFEATLRRFFRKYSPLIPDMLRKGFPLFFLCLQAAYWTLYLHIL